MDNFQVRCRVTGRSDAEVLAGKVKRRPRVTWHNHCTHTTQHKTPPHSFSIPIHNPQHRQLHHAGLHPRKVFRNLPTPRLYEMVRAS
jgi:hypothetical protein